MFKSYANVSFRAFSFSNKQQELVAKKVQILEDVFEYYNFWPASVLFVGFNPAILNDWDCKVFVTDIEAKTLEWLKDRVNVIHVPKEELGQYRKQVDCVVAVEEYFTFAQTDAEQRLLVDEICGLSRGLVITTLRDYKNQEFKDREFSSPSIVRNEQDYRIYLEFNNPDTQDRQLGHRTVFELGPDFVNTNSGIVYRNMYFKQLAKFSMDAGASEFLVHKNLMYKSLIKKNYEHVISIKFEQNGRNSKTT
jgi:hypothetical protein